MLSSSYVAFVVLDLDQKKLTNQACLHCFIYGVRFGNFHYLCALLNSSSSAVCLTDNWLAYLLVQHRGGGVEKEIAPLVCCRVCVSSTQLP